MVKSEIERSWDVGCWLVGPFDQHLMAVHFLLPCSWKEEAHGRKSPGVVGALDAIIGRDQGLLGMSEPLEARLVVC